MESVIIGSGVIRPIARNLVHRARRMRGSLPLHIGQIASARPLSRSSGFDRGTPINRYYIERFLAAHSDDIHGRVLEVGDDSYSRRFGGDRISGQDVLHIDDPAAAFVGDLGTPGLLPSRAFDCIILTQVLQYVFDVPAAMRATRGYRLGAVGKVDRDHVEAALGDHLRLLAPSRSELEHARTLARMRGTSPSISAGRIALRNSKLFDSRLSSARVRGPRRYAKRVQRAANKQA